MRSVRPTTSLRGIPPLGFRRPRRAVSLVTLLLFLVHTVYSGAGLAQSIIPDGRTQTNVVTSGNVTDVSTSTFAGAQAINSFERFNVDPGHAVNLHIPTTAANLLNLVHSGTTRIDGILNSIQDGAIGGNVYFLNPHGVVVGREGVINAGSLALITPAAAFMESFFAPWGEIDLAAVSAVLSGAVPISASGLVLVEGRVNAARDIVIAAGSVTNEGEIVSGGGFSGSGSGVGDGAGPGSGFGGGFGLAGLVNVDGLEFGGGLAVENGRIVIVAAGDLVNRGAVRADGTSGSGSGEIEIRSGGDVTFAAGSVASARGTGAESPGGRVVVFAGGDAALEPGALIDVRGGEISGDGGFAEFSARGTVRLAGDIRASAANGKAGSIAIDPEDVEVLADVFTDGADYIVDADNSITVAAGVTISTRQVAGGESGDHANAPSEGDSGSIQLTAPKITVGRGARLLAHAINEGGTDYHAGNIARRLPLQGR